MKKVAIAVCFLVAACSPNVYVVKDSYNTYASSYTSTYAPSPVYSPTQTTYTTMQPQRARKMVRRYRIIPGGAY